MATELTGRFFKMQHSDVVLFYLAMPFGWDGSPAHFAVFGDAITAAHCARGVVGEPHMSQFPFLSRMCADDGIFFEIDQSVRLKASTSAWEFFTRGLLGREAINAEKLNEEGQWSHSQIILGIEFDADSLCVRLPGAKMDVARILFGQIAEEKGTRFLHLKTLQIIRGAADHFESANAARTYLTAPVDSLMCFGAERSDWAVCPNKEIWGDFWRTMEVAETHLQTESAWRNLFEGQKLRMIKPEERLSLKLGKEVFVWNSVDATLEWISCVAWHGRQFFRVRVIDCLHYCPSRTQEPFRIAECELMDAV